MAAKYLHSLADENPDLHKQIGCMTSVFQIFNRHHIVAGRRVVGHSPKRVCPGSLFFYNGTPERESGIISQRPPTVDMHLNKHGQEKHRASTESSKDSFSSWSPPFPFSYVDCNIDRRPHPGRDKSSASRQMNHQSLDLRDVVKDSMYREARGLSHKTKMEKEAPGDVVNYRESHNVLAKLREANWYGDERRELSRSKSCQYKDGFPFSIPDDFPRFSYDGRETDCVSIKSGDPAKTTTPKQLKELPRLSLDSRERSIRTLNSVSLVPIKPRDSKSNLLSRNPKTNGGVSADKGLIQTRPPSVVAKLMGLETFPGSVSTSDEKLDVDPIISHLVEDLNSLSKSSKATDLCGSIKMPNSTRSSLRQPTSPCWKNPDMKPISRVPIEPAPWKQRDGAQSPQKPAPCVIRSSTKTHSPISSVYSEVDKRLKNLEFAQSGKDLRALKQILEAMQAVEARKGERHDTVERPSGHEMSPPYDHQYPPSANRGSNVSRANESHIVIMKPAKLVGKGSTNNKAGKDLITESTHGERRSCPPTPTDSSKPRKQSESRSPSGRRQRSNFQQSDDQNREISSELRKLSCRETQTSQQVIGGSILKMETEVNATEYSEETNSRQSSSSMPEVGESLTPEYPSPVSVLDDSVCMNNSPSHVKHTPNTRKDDATQNRADKIVKDRYGATKDSISSTINREKLQKVEHLVQKLKMLNSSHDEAHTDYIASLCENTNPDDRYISEIFLASGLLLRELGSFELHSSGHPINPQLFLVLEQTKFSNLQKEKFHRKLIFDAVNDILVGKLHSASRTVQDPRKLLRELCLEIDELQVQKKREIWEEEEEEDGLKSILWEDVLKMSENWIVFHDESQVIAMEVERLIFKDLINEVVMSEVCDGERGNPGRRHR